MGHRNPTAFERVEPLLLSTALDPAEARSALRGRRLEEDCAGGAERFRLSMMEEVRADLAKALLGLIRRRRPTLEDFVREPEPLPARHPLILDEGVRAIIAEHNGRALCHVAAVTAMRRDPGVERALARPARRFIVTPPDQPLTDDEAAALYAEELLYQRHGAELFRTLGASRY